RDLSPTLGGLLPGIRPHARTVKPKRSAWFRYLSPVLWMVPALPCAFLLAVRLFPAWREVTVFLFWMMWFPIGWMLILKLVDYLTAGLSFEQGTLTLRYSRGLILHTVAVKPCRIALITVRQSLFQRRGDSCDLLVYPFSEGVRFVKPHRVKGLDRTEAEGALGLYSPAVRS
ncbi:MAG: hypothetical protein ACERKO_02565, partial [Acetanaerobacterium sp.]